MNDKYFVPNEEDIRIEYKCEIQKVIKAWTHIVDNIIRTDLEYDEDWKSITIENKYELIPYLELIPTSHIRTPYLTKEQIENEGWTNEDEGINFFKADKDEYVFQCCFIENKLKITSLQTLPFSDITVFYGNCPSINEFHYICKLLKI